MPAPKGNSFWMKRTTIGRAKLFETPEVLWNAACEYFEECDNNPWIKKDWVGKDGDEVERETQRPYTQKGLCIFLDIDETTLSNYSTDPIYKAFFPITAHIKNIIYTCKFEGALVGAFNANLVARELGISDKQEIRHDVYDVKLNL